MKKLIKPKALKKGDLIATVSLSWGGAAEFPQRYEQGKKQFEEAFGVKIVEMKNSHKSAKELYENPKLRLDDFMEAFLNPQVSAVLCNIGGNDTIRLLRLMTEEHFEIIRNNPKVFLGMSDTTSNHLMCYKAGIGSFYSACNMFGYAENGGIPQYMIENTKKTLFLTEPVGVLPESSEFIVEKVNWGSESVIRQRTPSSPWRYIQGRKKVQGRLIGGCFDSLMMCINGTSLFPSLDDFEGSILFLENSEEMPSPEVVSYFLRTLGVMGILEKLSGILFARPGGEFKQKEEAEKQKWLNKYEAFDDVFLKICKEFDCSHLPIVTHMDFGHTVPQLVLPYGILTEIDPIHKQVNLLEPAVL